LESLLLLHNICFCWSYCPRIIASGWTVTVPAVWESSATYDKRNLLDWEAETTRGDDSNYGFVTTSCTGLWCQNTVHLLLWRSKVTKWEGKIKYISSLWNCWKVVMHVFSTVQKLPVSEMQTRLYKCT